MLADYSGSQRAAILAYGIDETDFALDIGCGNGEKTKYIAEHVEFAVGVDPYKRHIQAAKNNYKSGNLAFQVAKAEYLCFGDESFTSVLLIESLHHVQTDKQNEALEESFRVLKPGGKLFIIEPIFASGSFGQILNLYNDEKDQKQCAINAIKSMIGFRFKLALKKIIDIEYYFEGIDDLYEYHVLTKPSEQWSAAYTMDMVRRLEQCPRSLDGGVSVDYSAFVWLLIK